MIENIKILQKELNIQFSDKVEDNFPLIWLRDHAKDELNWDERSNQRKTFTARIDSNLQIKEAIILENGKSLSILWSDLNSAIEYSHDFLRKNIFSQKTDALNLKLWKSDDINVKTFIDYELATSKKGFKIFLKKLYDYGFCVIKDCKKELNTVEKIAKKIGYVRQSIFGGLWLSLIHI